MAAVSWCGAKARVRFQSSANCAETEVSNDVPEAEAFSRLLDAATDVSREVRQGRDSGVDKNLVHVNPSETRAEAVVGRHHHVRSSFVREFQEQSDRVVEPFQHRSRGAIPFGAVNAGRVDIEIVPGAVLEGVEVLELDHQGRPVGDERVGKNAPLGATDEAVDGQLGVFVQFLERLGGVFPEVFQGVVGNIRPQPRGELGIARQGGVEVWGVHAGDDHAAHLERRERSRDVHAHDRAARIGKNVPEGRNAAARGVIDLHLVGFEVVITMVEDAVTGRAATCHHARPGGGGHRRHDRFQRAMRGALQNGVKVRHQTELAERVDHGPSGAIKAEDHEPGIGCGHGG